MHIESAFDLEMSVEMESSSNLPSLLTANIVYYSPVSTYCDIDRVLPFSNSNRGGTVTNKVFLD